jgi:hypothetical protein
MTTKPKYKDWTDHICGHLRVLHEVSRPAEVATTARLWLCQCECGKQKVLKSNHLSQTISCGCKMGRPFSDDTKHLVTQNIQYSHHKHGARRRGWTEMPRTKWESIVSKPCYYCGGFDVRNIANTECYKSAGISQESNKRALYDIEINGVDRLHNSIGYVDSNVVPCCATCNSMKSNLEIDAFVRHLSTIRKHQNNGSDAKCVKVPEAERAQFAVNHEYRSHRSSAKKRGFAPVPRAEWEKVVFLPCFYCGGVDTRRGHPKSYMCKNTREKYLVSINGIDRVNPSLTYDSSNIVPCCGTCNVMKLDLSVTSFLNKVDKILNHFPIHA